MMNQSLRPTTTASSSSGAVLPSKSPAGSTIPIVKKPKKKQVKRLQKAQGARPFGGPSLQPPRPAPTRCAIVPSTTLLESERWGNFALLSPIDTNFAIMVGLYREQVEGNTTIPTKFDHYSEIKEVEGWVILEPELFVAKDKDANDALAWGQDFRLCLAHEWIERLLDYRDYHLSAVAILASDKLMNDPVTEKLTFDLMKTLKITPLKTFPAVPPTP